MEGNYSLADIATASRSGDGGFGFGSEGLWIFALLILLFGGNGFGGFGGSRVGEAYATQADIQRAVDLDTIKNGQSTIGDIVRTTTADTIGAVKDSAYNTLGELRDLQSTVNSGFASMSKCCCDLNSAILENRYLDAQNTAMINANTTASVQKILDTLQNEKIASLQSEISDLKNAQNFCGIPKINPYGYGVFPYANGCGCSGNI